MKKIKLFLLGAAVLGAASAFTVPPQEGDPYVLVNGNFIPKDITAGHCSNEGTICTYKLLAEDQRPDLNPPFSAADFSTNPSEHQTWVPN